MPQFIVNENFQFASGIKRVDEIVTVSDAFVKAEMAKGKKEFKSKGFGKKAVPKIEERWLSGLLNHCDPYDDAAEKLVNEPKRAEPPSDDEVAERVAAIKGEFDAIGAAFDNRWKLDRLEKELVKAKKERGM